MVNKHTTRTATVVLLLLVGLDLGIPSLCSAESVPAFGPPQEVGWSPISSNPSTPAAPVLGEEDCFCCCSHVKPAPNVLVTAGFTLVDKSSPATPRLTPPQRATLIFHPPKN